MPPRPSPVTLYLSELSPGSHPTMLFALGLACRFFGGRDPLNFGWHRVRVDQLCASRADLASRLAPNTANKVLAAVRGVLKAPWRMGLMSAEDLYRCADMRSVTVRILVSGGNGREREDTNDDIRAAVLGRLTFDRTSESANGI